MDMEVDLFSNNVFSEEEYTVEVVDYSDTLGVEGERCGICMDIVLDRGILDCCQHWFCFVCIDNWATITNLCPLCYNEFQLITCVPVLDTVGSGKNDEDLDSRDDDSCVEGKNNTSTFPSYYIDENAVTCLAGDGCKIRSGSMPCEEISALDTSIACDSCDTWYHVSCVGFNLEGTCVDLWLCPRCVTNEAQKAYLKEMYRSGINFDPHYLADMSSGKVSICGDAREAALVVSKIGGNNGADEPIMNCISNRGRNSIRLESMGPYSKFRETVIKSEPVDEESGLSLDLGQSLVSSLFDDRANNLSGCNGFLHNASLDENIEVLKANIVPGLGEKRKNQWSRSSFQTSDEDEHHEGRLVGPPTNKLKVQQVTRSTGTSLNDQQILAVLMTLRQRAS